MIKNTAGSLQQGHSSDFSKLFNEKSRTFVAFWLNITLWSSALEISSFSDIFKTWLFNGSADIIISPSLYKLFIMLIKFFI